MSKLKILLSAYACEPAQGSEPAVGWQWALTLAKAGHHVYVLTRKSNQATIETGLLTLNKAIRNQLEFIYYDLPKWLIFWKKGRQGVHFYYLLWQLGAFFQAKALHKNEPFDLVHHVTLANIQMPTFMGYLGIPFILGPVGGGDSIPKALRKSMSFKTKFWESLRDLKNSFVKYDGLVQKALQQATRIYVNSDQTRALIPTPYQHKTFTALAIAYHQDDNYVREENFSNKSTQKHLRVLYAGNLLYLKGIHLALKAFQKFHRLYPNRSTFTLVGSGEDGYAFKTLAQTLGLSEPTIKWIAKVPQEKLFGLYKEHDVLLFPSLRDSGGFVVLEAMAYQLPCIVLKLGGPGNIISDKVGISIPVENKSEDQVIEALFEGLQAMIQQSYPASNFSNHLENFSWDCLAKKVYAPIIENLCHVNG